MPRRRSHERRQPFFLFMVFVVPVSQLLGAAESKASVPKRFVCVCVCVCVCVSFSSRCVGYIRTKTLVLCKKGVYNSKLYIVIMSLRDSHTQIQFSLHAFIITQ